ncbi:Sec8 exocyst complex component-specific domain-containing protein [Ephemerocybe angulata]|uniref:Exocyst complex component Sec8 n=1 Tax=Ephemerocybe angulata TaxID=980116 RepID=A0A8H6MF85_9AGAR|nr:Sec8 exocyst complex component-specific domain-containing protein [Tulosesus angulatus]
MSRNPPFPNRRRAPSAASNDVYNSQPTSAPGTSNIRPLVPRSPSRPTTPTSSTYRSGSPQYSAPNTAPIGPLRPQRSELRARASEYSNSERGSVASNDPYYRDSYEGSRPDPRAYPTSNPNTPHSRTRTPRAVNGAYPSDGGEINTPTSLGTVLSAFKSAGSRKNTVESEDAEYWRERDREIEAEKARQQRIRERAPGIRPARGNTRAGEIDGDSHSIQQTMYYLIPAQLFWTSNVELALQLLDQSSLGKDMDSFRNTKQMLSRALKGSVDKHYQAFAASLPHHASLLNHLGDTQDQISTARASLQETKESLGSKRSDLVQLWNRGQTLEEMIRILDQIEHLKTVPDLLETLMSEKRLLQAAVLLVKSLKMINNPDMQEIGAVSDLRSYLVGQEAALRDILIDELQSHLYLKSFWCESRWASYVPNQQTLPKCDYDDEDTTGNEPPVSPTSPSYRPTRLTRYLNGLALRPNEPPMDISDAGTKQSRRTSMIGLHTSFTGNPSSLQTNGNPESDSFAYMETLLESLAVLGKLGNALDSISQRLPGEIHNLVETTLDEVEERAEYGRRRSLLSVNGGLGRSDGVYIFALEGTHSDGKGRVSASLLRLAALESSSKRVDHEILKDLFWTLYSKFDAVGQGLRVVSEVANRIGSRRDYKDSSETKPGTLFPLTEVWQPIQAEVRKLISDYLTDEQQGSAASRNPISSINEILREGKFLRDRVKPVFRFSDTDSKSTNKALRSHEEGLTKVLKDTMPGLAPADAFHVTILFQPTLSFLERMTDTLPAGVESVRTSSAVLDDVVLKVYLPQLEEKVLDLFHEAVSDAATQLMALINSLCAMLETSPFHRENYSRLILGVVIQFYQRCSDRFQTLTSTSPPGSLESQIALAAQWAQKADLQPPLTELRNLSECDTAKEKQLCRQETNIELEYLRQQNIQREDLIASNRNLSALASLYRSMWFSSELNAIKSVPENFGVPTSPNGLTSPGLEPTTAITAVTPYLPPLPKDPSGQLKLPLSREMAMRFQALIRTYDQLSSLILDTLRIDIRCRAMYYLDASMRHGNYNASYEAAEPDSHIVDLNTELVQCDELTTSGATVFAGLGKLMQHMTIYNARHLRFPNEFGMKKQSLRTLNMDEKETEFERAKRYYAMFNLSPREMLDGIKQRQAFGFDEYQTMLNLQCAYFPGDGSTSATKPPDRNYNHYVIELHSLELEDAESA